MIPESLMLEPLNERLDMNDGVGDVALLWMGDVPGRVDVEPDAESLLALAGVDGGDAVNEPVLRWPSLGPPAAPCNATLTCSGGTCHVARWKEKASGN